MSRAAMQIEQQQQEQVLHDKQVLLVFQVHLKPRGNGRRFFHHPGRGILAGATSVMSIRESISLG